MTTRVRRLGAAAATTILLGLVGAACSANDGDNDAGYSADSSDSSADGSAAGAADEAEPAAPAAEAPVDADAFLDVEAADGAPRSAGGSSEPPAPAPRVAPGDGRSLLKTGNVALRSDDVVDTRFQVLKSLQARGGEVAEDSTSSDEDGAAVNALMTLRVPVDSFEKLMADLEGLNDQGGVDVIDAGSTTEDVSTEVIDTDVRVALQKRSIERISLLLDRAESIKDVVGIEAELARREADLGSLQKQQTFLADQTALSTVTVSIEKRDDEVKAEEKKAEKDESGFVAGLKGGWTAFTTATTGVLTGAGALLPFALLALVVGVPLRVWLRRRPAPARPPIVTPDPSA